MGSGIKYPDVGRNKREKKRKDREGKGRGGKRRAE